MSENSTIADSKKAFHKEFPYVIPAIYRRFADELLVELHLLSHQKNFRPTSLFAVGLVQAFNDFTKGYRPEKHLEELFKSICRSTGIDPVAIKTKSDEIMDQAKGLSNEQIKDWFDHYKTKEESTWTKLAKSESRINFLEEEITEENCYSRLLIIGLSSLITSKESIEIESKGESSKTTIDIAEILGMKRERAERDLAAYNSNRNKMVQALELIQETIETERKKKLKSS